MIRVIIRFVDGGIQEFDEGLSFLKKLSDLKKIGYDGKDLIHALLTDDWGPPPSHINIKGKSETGKKIDITIPYK